MEESHMRLAGLLVGLRGTPVPKPLAGRHAFPAGARI